MPATNVCPSADNLERLARGELSSVAADRLAGHLERCERCAASVARLRGQAETPPHTQGLAQTETASPPADAATDFLDPPRAAGELGWLAHYRVLKRLGQGGMGQVFLAEDTVLVRPVALKVMQPALAKDPAARDRFLREARAAAALTDDHVITIHQVDEVRGTPFLAMQLLQGESLAVYLKKSKRLTTRHICRIGRETALGLAAAHAKGLIHRDIKPANLWLESPKGRVKILDFGLARAASDDAHLTGSGQVLGTPAYMSPEQARGLTLDSRCDLWSLGVVLYRLCAGKMPFAGPDVISVLTAIAVDDPPSLRTIPDVPAELAELIAQLLSKDRTKRPESAREVADRLLRIERDLTTATAGGSAPTPSATALEKPVAPAPAPRRRRFALSLSVGRWRIALTMTIGAILVLAVGGGYWFMTVDPTAAPDTAVANLTTPAPEAKSPPPAMSPAPAAAEPRPSAAPPSPPAAATRPADPPPPDPATARRAGPPLPEPPPDARRGAPPPTPGSAADPRKGAPPPAPTAPPVRVLTSHKTEVGLASAPLVLDYGPDGQTLFVIDRESVRIHDTATGTYRSPQPFGATLRRTYKGTFAHAALTPDGKTLALVLHGDDNALGGATHRVVLWDVTTGRERGTLPTPSRYDALAFRADGKLLATSTDTEIRLWDLTRPLPNSRIGAVAETKVTDLAFSPKEPILAIGTADGRVRLWAMAQNRDRWRSTTQSNTAVQGLTFSPDGRWLAATTADERFIRVWEVATGKVVANLVGMGKQLAFSPDGQLLAIGSVGLNGTENRRLELFDMEAKRVVARSGVAHANFIAAIAFAPDGQTIVTGSTDKTIKFWDVPAAPR